MSWVYLKLIFKASGMDAQKGFVNWLVRIGNNLKEEPTKGEKTRRLVSELLVLNMHLPARVWIPLSEGHVVLNIPPTNSCVLNSKDKAPYCIFVEVLRCSDVKKVRLPKRPVTGEDYPQLPLQYVLFATYYPITMSYDYSSSSIASLDDALMKSADTSPGTPTTSDFQPMDDSVTYLISRSKLVSECSLQRWPKMLVLKLQNLLGIRCLSKVVLPNRLCEVPLGSVID
ncbi:unnamed protein product [Cylicostephanus goldi]|uniref:Uncharacterized protein n=1 Tax=Cylicostephanus goldi TaxID=71465 RepID=A0A3P7PR59_CYLGO|nr:unnamed protein product [Cylicostephanus goldi]